jgi:TP901 family phage tail tape measure protein
MAASSPKTASRSIYIDQSSAERALVNLTGVADKLEKSITKGSKAGKDMTAEIEKLGKTKANIAEVESAISKGLRPAFTLVQQDVTKLQNELKRMSRDAPGYAAKFEEFTKSRKILSDLRQEMNGVEKAQNSWMDTAKAVGFGVTIANVVNSAISAVKNGITSIISLRSNFENSLANLSSITGATGIDLEFLKKSAIDLSKSSTNSATDFVEAFKLIASAKPELLSAKEDLVAVTKAADLLAKASGIDLPDASKRLTDALNQYGAPAAEAAGFVDALAAAAKFGAAEVPDVTDALLQFGTQAKSSNINIYESAAAIELLAEKGIKGAEAGTKLRNVFLAMNAVNALDKKAIDALAAAGVNTQKLSDKTLSLEERLQELSKISNNSTALVQVFGKENFNAGQIILQNIPRYAELAEQVKETGVASAQAAVNTDTLSQRWEVFKNVLASRFLGGTSDFLKSIVNGMIELVTPTKTAADEFGELADEIISLEKNTVPLLSRYDELQAKAKSLGGETKLSKEEQAELKKIISQVTEVMPGAVTQFDQYGNAVAISTTRVREFIDAERDRLKVVNADAITERQKQLNTVKRDMKEVQKDLDEIAKRGTFSIGTDLGEGQTSFRDANAAEIRARKNHNQDLISQERGLLQEIERLNGDALKKRADQQAASTKEQAEKKAQAEKDAAAAAANAPDDKGDKEAEKKRQDFLKKLKQLQFEISLLGKDADEQEIQRTLKKYKELTAEATQYGVDVIQVEKLKNRELAFLIDKFEQEKKRKREEEFKKSAAAEYQNSLKLSADYFEGLKLQEAKMYVDGEIDKRTYESNIASIEVEAKNNLIIIAQDYAGTVKQAEEDILTFKKQKTKEEIDEAIKKREKQIADDKLLTDIAKRNALARAQDRVILSRKGTEENLRAQIDLQRVERDQALANESLTEDEKQKIRDEYRLKEAETSKNFYIDQVNQVLSFISQALDIVSKFNQAKDAREKAALDRELRDNASKKNDLKKLFDQKLLTEQEYKKQTAKLDAEADAKKQALEKKQFERQKRIQIAQAIINGAMAVTAVLAAIPGPIDILSLGLARTLQIAFTVASTAAQIATISGQKFEKGGIARGGRHSQGGISMIDSQTGRKVGEMEGGEPYLILSRNTYSNNSDVIDELLYNSQHRNGARVKPFWQNRSYQGINYSGISQSQKAVRFFENGGVFEGDGKTSTQQSSSPAIIIHDDETKLIMRAVLHRLENPVAPTVDIPLTKIQAAENLQNSIIADATP